MIILECYILKDLWGINLILCLTILKLMMLYIEDIQILKEMNLLISLKNKKRQKKKNEFMSVFATVKQLYN